MFKMPLGRCIWEGVVEYREDNRVQKRWWKTDEGSLIESDFVESRWREWSVKKEAVFYPFTFEKKDARMWEGLEGNLIYLVSLWECLIVVGKEYFLNGTFEKKKIKIVALKYSRGSWTKKYVRFALNSV